MCIFSSEVRQVSDTSIFARRAPTGGQYLVYSMHYEARRRLAMILPLPTPRSAPEDAVRFIDLSRYPHFFSDMAAGFPEQLPVALEGGIEGAVARKPRLKVQEVGSFEASFVPELADFSRLDPRFRLPSGIWGQLPRYSGYGFAVFKLQAGEQRVHPMAFYFQSRASRRLFIPTVHVHHGRVEPRAHFSHTIYCQTLRPVAGWRASSAEVLNGIETSPRPWDPRDRREAPASKFMDMERTLDIVDPVYPVFRKALHGLRRNADVWVGG